MYCSRSSQRLLLFVGRQEPTERLCHLGISCSAMLDSTQMLEPSKALSRVSFKTSYLKILGDMVMMASVLTCLGSHSADPSHRMLLMPTSEVGKRCFMAQTPIVQPFLI